MRIRIRTLTCLLTAVLVIGPAFGQSPDAADLFPESAVVFVEADNLGALVRGAYEHPLKQRIEELPDVAKALASPELGFARTTVEALEKELGAPLLETLETLTARGASFCLDPASDGGAALLLNARDEASLTKVLDAALKRIRATPASPADIVKQVEYRGLQAYRVGEARFVRLGSSILITNKSDLGKGIIDRYLDQGQGLSTKKRFQQARTAKPASASVWAYLDIDTLRSAGAAKELFAGKTDNPLAELLVGGLLSHLQHTPLLTMSMEFQQSGLKMSFVSPHDPSWIEESRQFYLGLDSGGQAPQLLDPPGTIFSLAAHRDIAGMWVHAGDLFDQNVNDQLAQADSTFTTLFSGKDFGEDVLGSLGPEIQLVIARQTFGDILPQPAIRLPEFAARFRLLKGDEMQDDFRRTLQSLLGFLNVVGAQNGNPQLDFETERRGDVQTLKSRYIPESDERQSKAARIVYNFSPSALFDKDQMTLSSTNTLVEKLMQAPGEAAQPPAKRPNTVLRLNAQPLAAALRDNLDQLVAQNMIEEGHTREEAEQAIETLLNIVGWFSNAELSLQVADQNLHLDMSVELSDLE